jgi:hypothetical protein
MSLNHINSNELDANFKSLKINNVPLVTSATTQEFINFWWASWYSSSSLLISPGNGVATAAAELENQICPL